MLRWTKAAAAALLICGAGGAIYVSARGRPALAQPAASAGGTGAAAAARCAALADQRLDRVEIKSARLQPAGAPVAGAMTMALPHGPPPAPISGLPAFCRVVGAIHPEPGSDIRFEVWMPAQGWDGRLNGGGSGGFAGSISYMPLAGAVRAGQAGVSTDTGHEASPMTGAWAKGHPERIRDYGWRAQHLSAVVAKKLVAAYYGRAPDHSYFVACSNGGREALMEASRFPDDYDGIVAGAPAAVWTDLAMSMIWTVQAQMPPGAAIRPEQTKLLQAEVLRQCDALDGQRDGLVADPRRCRFDPSKLTCGTAKSPLCFTPAQVAALRRIYAGPRDASGRRIAAAYPATGSEVGVPSPLFGWDGWIFGTPQTPAYHSVYPAALLQDFFAKPFADVKTFDFNRDPARLKAALAPDLDARPDMRRFFDRGGKLIVWQGWADPAIPPPATLSFYENILRTSGPRARQSVRLFMLPGVQHCFGGPGPDMIGQMTAPPPGETPERSVAAAIQAWVETGREPESLVGRMATNMAAPYGAPIAGPEKQRLICAYPAQAALRPGADPDKAASYVCRPPPPARPPRRPSAAPSGRRG